MKVVLSLLLLWTASSWAAPKHTHEHEEVDPHAESEFKVDKNLLDEMYKAEVTEVQVETRYRTGAVDVGPQLSLVNPTEFELINNYFKVPYQEGMKGAPLAQFVLTTPIARFGGYLELHGQGRIGYSYRENIYDVLSQSGATFSGIVRLHWLPVSAALRLSVPVPGLRGWVKLSLAGGGGAQFLSQHGELDGIEQDFWVPFVFVAPALTILDARDSGGWFGGLSLGATTNRSLSSLHKVNFWSIDLSTSLVL